MNQRKDPRLITCLIGGSIREEFLIDSGASINIIPRTTWDKIWTDEDCFIFDAREGCSKRITAYGGKPLDVWGTFKAHIQIPNTAKPQLMEEFFVIEEGGSALMSFNTARKMKIIKIGTDVNLASDTGGKTETFPSIPGLKVRFIIDDSVRPVRNSSFRIPASLEEEVEKQLDDLEKKGIIENARYESPWMSRMDVVVKEKSKWRIVIDMRAVNKAICRELYPLPTMEKFMKKLCGARHFTKLDLKSAFHHVLLDENSRDLTTFMTPKGPRRFTRLLFGVNCAPEIFQREMEKVLHGCLGTIVYIDDILIFANTKEELETREKAVLQKLKENNLTLNEPKCFYGVEQVEFLGSTLSKHGVAPAAEKVDAIKNFRRPKDRSELRSFIGLVTYISPSIKNFADTMEPLNRLLRKENREEWGPDQDAAFAKIKQSLEDDIVTRAFFDVNCPTKLFTDASPTALGAVLVQQQKDPETGILRDRVVACASKTLVETEKRYAQTHKEALAVVWGAEKFNYYLHGREFELNTDHEPLLFIFNRDKISDKRSLTRAEGWALRLSTFNFKVRYVPSKLNIADPLSRLCIQNDEAFNEDNAPHEIASISANPDITTIGGSHETITAEEILQETAIDKELLEVTAALKSDSWPEALRKFELIKDEIIQEKGFILRENRFILPVALREKALEIAHESHPGVTTMRRFLRHRMWWPGMDQDILEKVKNCSDCIYVARDNAPAPMKRTPLPHGKWEFLALDFYSAKDPDFTVLVIVDYFSRFSRATFVKSTDGESTIKALNETFDTFGKPRKFLTDNGPPFQSEMFNKWCISQGIKLIHSTPLWPRQNGMVERFMQNLTKVITIAKIHNKSPREAVRNLIYNYNRRPHATTGEIPMKMMMGRDIFDQLPSARTSLVENSDDESTDEVRLKDAANKQKGKDYSDSRNHARASSIEPGDKVVIKNQGKSKIAPNYGTREFKVVTKSGAELALEDLKRNAAHAKKIPPESTKGKESEDSPAAPTRKTAPESSTKQRATSGIPERPIRINKPIDRYQAMEIDEE